MTGSLIGFLEGQHWFHACLEAVKAGPREYAAKSDNGKTPNVEPCLPKISHGLSCRPLCRKSFD